jgi:hypothetical protein
MRLILPIFLILVAGLLSFLFTKPLLGEIKQLKLEISTYNTALNNSGELIIARDSLLEVYNRGIKIEDKNKLDHLLPSSINSIELALEIGKIANLHGIPIHDISFDSIKIKNGDPSTNEEIAIAEEGTENLPYNIFPMSFVVDGRYDTFLNFLKDLETNLRLVDVKSISFTLPTSSPDQKNKVNPNVYSYSLKIDTYWLK